jgi:hypothetical protein
MVAERIKLIKLVISEDRVPEKKDRYAYIEETSISLIDFLSNFEETDPSLEYFVAPNLHVALDDSWDHARDYISDEELDEFDSQFTEEKEVFLKLCKESDTILSYFENGKDGDFTQSIVAILKIEDPQLGLTSADPIIRKCSAEMLREVI